MYAVIATGGKQYRVPREKPFASRSSRPAGTKVTFDQVLFVDDGGDVKVGQPIVMGVKVEAEIVEQALARRSSSSSTGAGRATAARNGHRQPFTALKITAIRSGDEGLSHGSQKRSGLLAQRPRLAAEAAWRQAARRRGRGRRQHPGSPGRHRRSTRARTSGWAATSRCSRSSTAW